MNLIYKIIQAQKHV